MERSTRLRTRGVKTRAADFRLAHPAITRCAFRIPVRIEMIDVFVALGQRAFDVAPCPSGSLGCDSISAVVSRTVPSRRSRASPPAPRPQAPVRRKARPLSDLRPSALVLAFTALAGMASRTPLSFAWRLWSAGTDKASTSTGAGKAARGRLDDRPLSQRFVISSWKCIARIPRGVGLFFSTQPS